MAEFMRTLVSTKSKEAEPFTYRILCDGKLVDFSPTYEGIMSKYKRYAQDCLDGYSDCVSVIRIHPETNEEYVMFTYRRDEPFKNLSKPFKNLSKPFKEVRGAVHCKDCKWCHVGYCEKYDDLIPWGCANKPWEDWFCADGKRREAIKEAQDAD